MFALSLLTEADAGHTEFTDEVFHNETRFPGGDWKPATEPYTDVVRHMHKHTHTYRYINTHTASLYVTIWVWIDLAVLNVKQMKHN